MVATNAVRSPITLVQERNMNKRTARVKELGSGTIAIVTAAIRFTIAIVCRVLASHPWKRLKAVKIP